MHNSYYMYSQNIDKPYAGAGILPFHFFWHGPFFQLSFVCTYLHPKLLFPIYVEETIQLNASTI